MSISRFFTQSVTVEKFLGTAQSGDKFDAPVELAPPNGVFVDGMQAVTRSTTGEEITLTGTTLYTWLANAPLFVVDSRVTVGGRIARVVGVNVNDTGRPSVDHVAVNLI